MILYPKRGMAREDIKEKRLVRVLRMPPGPMAMVLAALLFATLSQGALGMQNVAGVPQDIVLVIQALVIFFVAAPQIVRALPQWLEKRRAAAQAAAEGVQLEGGQA